MQPPPPWGNSADQASDSNGTLSGAGGLRGLIRRNRILLLTLSLLAMSWSFAASYAKMVETETKKRVYREGVAEYFDAITRSDWPAQFARVDAVLLDRAGRAATAVAAPATMRGDRDLLATLAESGSILLTDASGRTTVLEPRWTTLLDRPSDREASPAAKLGGPLPALPLGNYEELTDALVKANPVFAEIFKDAARAPATSLQGQLVQQLRAFQSPEFVEMQRRAMTLPTEVRAAIEARDADRLIACLHSAGPEANDAAIMTAGLLEARTIRVRHDPAMALYPLIEFQTGWPFGAPSPSEYGEVLAPLRSADPSKMPTAALLAWHHRLERLAGYQKPGSGFMDGAFLGGVWLLFDIGPLIALGVILAIVSFVIGKIR